MDIVYKTGRIEICCVPCDWKKRREWIRMVY